MRKKNVGVPENYCHTCYRLGAEILNAHQDIEDVLDEQKALSGKSWRGGILLSYAGLRKLRKANAVIGKNITKIIPG